jgi:putative oxidoreductase
MSTGLVLLRIWLAAMLFGHAAGKGKGWWRAGAGPEKASSFFDSIGLRPGRAMVYVAAVCETLAGIGLLVGLITPISAAVGAGTMLVAAYVQSARGLWNLNGGAELPLTYAVISVALGFTGAGRASLDNVLGLEDLRGPGWGLVTVALAALSAASVAVRAARLRRATKDMTSVD